MMLTNDGSLHENISLPYLEIPGIELGTFSNAWQILHQWALFSPLPQETCLWVSYTATACAESDHWFSYFTQPTLMVSAFQGFRKEFFSTWRCWGLNLPQAKQVVCHWNATIAHIVLAQDIWEDPFCGDAKHVEPPTSWEAHVVPSLVQFWHCCNPFMFHQVF